MGIIEKHLAVLFLLHLLFPSNGRILAHASAIA